MIQKDKTIYKFHEDRDLFHKYLSLQKLISSYNKNRSFDLIVLLESKLYISKNKFLYTIDFKAASVAQHG